MHLIAKDILKFHAVIWPALLMAAEIELPERVGIHGYLLMGEHKMSKSLGNVIDPFQVVDLYGADALRFYLLREVRFGQDGEVSPEGFEQRYRGELANEYGNLASRTLAMIERYRDGVVPEAEPPGELAAEFEGLAESVCARIDGLDLSLALDEIWRRVKRLNAYVQDEAAVAAGQGRRRRRRSSTRCSTRWPRGCGWSRCCCTRSCRSRRSGCWRRSAARTARWTARASARCAAGRGSASSVSSSRRSSRGGGAGGLIDTHCHLDACDAPSEQLVARAREAGVSRLATVGTDPESIERALAAAEAHEEVVAIVGRHPNAAPASGRRRPRPSSAPRSTRAPARSARRDSTTTATTRRARTSAAPSSASSSWHSGRDCRS